jgi:hypothetical protein
MNQPSLEQQRSAYRRARDSFDRLQALTDQWNNTHGGRRDIGSHGDWMEDWREYNQFRQEWDAAFAEFDTAVNEYSSTLHTGEGESPDRPNVAPRKPR